MSADDRWSDPIWDELAAGELDPEERAALEALASEDELEAFRPLDDAFRDRLAGALTTQVRHARSRRRFALAATTSVLAAAAAVVLVVRPFADPRFDEPPSAEVVDENARAASARFVGELRGGVATERSASPEPGASPEPAASPGLGSSSEGGAPQVLPTFHPETRLELVVRPLREGGERSMAHATFVRVDGTLRPWDVPVERARSGAARVVGTAGALLDAVPPGVVELVIAIDDTPASAERVERWIADGDPRVLRFPARFVLGPATSDDEGSR
ncbi:MAG: hypothetical protein KF901_11055 [Myxococcales bacterium]|nr:hypothetical protein [Myxococcales bacterium]